MLQHVTHNYIINFIKRLLPLASEAHCGYTSLHKYVVLILVFYLFSNLLENVFQLNIVFFIRSNKVAMFFHKLDTMTDENRGHFHKSIFLKSKQWASSFEKKIMLTLVSGLQVLWYEKVLWVSEHSLIAKNKQKCYHEFVFSIFQKNIILVHTKALCIPIHLGKIDWKIFSAVFGMISH